MRTPILVLSDVILDDSVTKFLQLNGYAVITAAQVSEAVKVLEERRVRLLLTSVEHLGRSLERVIEDAMSRDPMLAVLVVSREATLQICWDLRKRCGVDVLRVPLTLVDLRDGVRGALDARDVWSPMTRLRDQLDRLSSEEMSERSREIVRHVSKELDALASRVRSVTGGR
jgi:DNA-binding NtrC family response regulator